MTRSAAVKFCESHDIELSVERPTGGGSCWHVHAYTTKGKVFSGLGTHNMSLWDSYDAPDWRAILRELRDLPPEDCTIDDCEICSEEDEL